MQAGFTGFWRSPPEATNEYGRIRHFIAIPGAIILSLSFSASLMAPCPAR